MFSFSLFWLLIPYIIFLAIFVVFLIIDIYHLIEAGAYNARGFFVTFFVATLAVINLTITWMLLSDIDWTEPLILF